MNWVMLRSSLKMSRCMWHLTLSACVGCSPGLHAAVEECGRFIQSRDAVALRDPVVVADGIASMVCSLRCWRCTGHVLPQFLSNMVSTSWTRVHQAGAALGGVASPWFIVGRSNFASHERRFKPGWD